MKQLDVNFMHPAEQIAVIIKRIYRSGMTTTSGGNVSIRDDNGDIWITPSAIDKGTLKPSDIMRVTADGTIIGPHKPSSEYPFHRAIYNARPEIRAIIHAHPPGKEPGRIQTAQGVAQENAQRVTKKESHENPPLQK